MDQLEFDIDPHEYRDQIDDRESNAARHKEDLFAENESLEDTIRGFQDAEEILPEAGEVLNRIRDFLGEDSPVVQKCFADSGPPERESAGKRSVLGDLHSRKDGGGRIPKQATVTAVANQKGGTGKTTTCENLGVGLAMQGKKVLLVDIDPQASLTVSLGFPQPDNLKFTLSDVMQKVMNEEPLPPGEGILHCEEQVDLMPSNIELAGTEVSLVNAMSRERTLGRFLDTVKDQYDNILLDCMPSLGMLTVNALAAADNVIVPVQAQYLSAKGLEQLLQTISKVQHQINPDLKIEGVLMTMVDNRTNYSRDMADLVRDTYGASLNIFKTEIPRSVRAEELSAEGKSIFAHDPKGKVAEAYRDLTKEVMDRAEKGRKHHTEQLR